MKTWLDYSTPMLTVPYNFYNIHLLFNYGTIWVVFQLFIIQLGKVQYLADISI